MVEDEALAVRVVSWRWMWIDVGAKICWRVKPDFQPLAIEIVIRKLANVAPRRASLLKLKLLRTMGRKKQPAYLIPLLRSSKYNIGIMLVFALLEIAPEAVPEEIAESRRDSRWIQDRDL
jgi:hypothetical protein